MGLRRDTEGPRALDNDITALLDADQVAKLLGLSAATVKAYARSGVLPGHRLMGGFSAPWRFSEAEVRAAWRRHLLKQEVAKVMVEKQREELVSRCRQLFADGKDAALRALLARFGVSNLNQLPPDQFPSFRAHLLRLGHRKP